MFVIYGDDNAEKAREKYVVLEMYRYTREGNIDPAGEIHTYLAVTPEDMYVDQIPRIETHKRNHEKLIENFYKPDWNFCEQMIPHLKGKFSKDADDFYSHMLNQITDSKEE